MRWQLVSLCESGRPFRAVQRFLQSKPLARQLGLPAYVLTKAAQLVLRESVEVCLSSSVYLLCRVTWYTTQLHVLLLQMSDSSVRRAKSVA